MEEIHHGPGFYGEVREVKGSGGTIIKKSKFERGFWSFRMGK